MAQIHKKQTLQLPAPKNKAHAKADADVPLDTNKKNGHEDNSKFALKCFVFVMSLALMLTTILGVMMAFRSGGKTRAVWVVLLLGVLFPVAILLL